MNIAERITEELKTAMRAKDQIRMDTLRMVKSDFKNAEIARGSAGPALTEEDMLSIIQKSIKRRQDSIDQYKSGGRQDLVDKETREVEILKAFLPAQMGESEVRALAKDAVAESGASSKKDMGKVMGILMPKVKGKADGRMVQQVVSELLP